MIIKQLGTCKYSRILDKTLICELLHPERELNLDMGFSIAPAILKSVESSVPYCLKSSVEIHYILDGNGVMHIENEKQEIKSDHAIYIPPKSVQWIENTSDSKLKFLCMVYPPWRAEDEELVKK
jgi:mannose-6-phosphate isomerase-like protein (cupin superfamily)